jgi:hypothetical protein
MKRLIIKLIRRGIFHDVSKVHDSNHIADVPNHIQVVGNEEIAEAKPSLQIFDEIYDLRLDGDIKRRYRLVTYDQRRLYAQSTGYADALPLAAAEFMWIAISRAMGYANKL